MMRRRDSESVRISQLYKLDLIMGTLICILAIMIALSAKIKPPPRIKQTRYLSIVVEMPGNAGDYPLQFVGYRPGNSPEIISNRDASGIQDGASASLFGYRSKSPKSDDIRHGIYVNLTESPLEGFLLHVIDLPIDEKDPSKVKFHYQVAGQSRTDTKFPSTKWRTEKIEIRAESEAP